VSQVAADRAERWVEVGVVARPHGVQGELRITLHNKDSDVLLDVDEVLVKMADGAEHEVSVDGARRADQAILLRLYSVDSRDRAEELRGARLSVKRSQFAQLEPGEFYACDVEGAKVVVPQHGEEAAREGIVRELLTYPSVSVLVVEVGGLTYEVPLVDAFVASVDADAQLVTIRTLEGVEGQAPRPDAAK
jgi:16S rRNA processing protein RimM